VLSFIGTRKPKLVPGKTPKSFRDAFEFIRNLTDSIMEMKEKIFILFFWFVLFIFVGNLLGLYPVLPRLQEALIQTIALAIIVFLSTHYLASNETG